MSYLECLRHADRFRAALLGAAVVAFSACNSNDTLDPSTTAAPDLGGPEAVPVSQPEAAATFAGGIPIGLSTLPVTLYGNVYNGALRTPSTSSLRSELADIKARGGKVVVSFSGNEKYYKDAAGHFSMTKWKARVARFKNIDFSSYIKDGTIVGHYLIDEPNDPRNWNGQPVSGSTVDQMAQYSKQLWPTLTTIVRTEPGYFKSAPRYLDAAWAQYLYRRGDVNTYIKKQVADAQRLGLQLVVGLNVIHGGNPNGTQMSASEVKSWGSALLSSSYPCAFISWQYNSSYLSSSSIKDAMNYLRNKAEARSTKSCH
jgi:hypothetical protein